MGGVRRRGYLQYGVAWKKPSGTGPRCVDISPELDGLVADKDVVAEINDGATGRNESVPGRRWRKVRIYIACAVDVRVGGDLIGEIGNVGGSRWNYRFDAIVVKAVAGAALPRNGILIQYQIKRGVRPGGIEAYADHHNRVSGIRPGARGCRDLVHGVHQTTRNDCARSYQRHP